VTSHETWGPGIHYRNKIDIISNGNSCFIQNRFTILY